MADTKMVFASLMLAYDRIARATQRKHAEAFALADRLLSAAHALLRGPINTDHRGIVLSLLYGRVLSATHAAVVMVRLGRDVEADTLLRSALEAGFRLASIACIPERLNDYIAEGPAVRRRAMEDLRAHLAEGAPTHESVTDASIDEVLRDIDRERQRLLQQTGQTKLRKREVYEWASDAGQIDLFRMKYLLLSESAHHSARDLERALVRRSDGSVEALRFVPKESRDIKVEIADVMVVLAHAVDAFGAAMGLETSAFSAEYAAVQTIHAKAADAFKGPPPRRSSPRP
jgi:hypothetical protein